MNSHDLRTTDRPRASFACVRCTARKVKCDKLIPCSACNRHSAECIFRKPDPPRRKRKTVPVDELADRLQRYEALLREKGVDIDQVPEEDTTTMKPQSEPVHQQVPTASSPQVTSFQPQILQSHQGTRIVDNSLWSRIADEIDADSVDGTSDDDDGGDEHPHLQQEGFDYVLLPRTPIATVQPQAADIRRLWHMFVERVDPLYKIVHVPSLQPVVERIMSDPTRISRSLEALMFAIYSVTVLSLSKGECQAMFNCERRVLLDYYASVTKAALSKANFTSSTSLVTLQAFFLHVVSIRNYAPPRSIFALTGLLLRVADSMGLRIDGAMLALPPFEVELRRRLWWQIIMHDFRAAELSGHSKLKVFEFTETTPKKPTNVNDADIFPGMANPPIESERATDAIWIALRAEMALFAGSQKKALKLGDLTSDEYSAIDDLKMKDEAALQLQHMLETRYLRFCDPTNPLQMYVMCIIRASINTIRFLGHHPRRWLKQDHVPEEERKLVWDTTLRMIEQYDFMQSSELLAPFAWNGEYFMQWQAVIHVLDTIRAHPLCAEADRVWYWMERLYKRNAELLLEHTTSPIFGVIGNLCLKAWMARCLALESQNSAEPQPPDFIVSLRTKQEVARSRRARAIARKQRSSQRVPDSKVSETERQHLTQASQRQRPLHEAFWEDELRNISASNASSEDFMQLDANAAWALDSWLDTPEGGAIDWAQWDAWFGDISMPVGVTS
jgi:hypothetical protein